MNRRIAPSNGRRNQRQGRENRERKVFVDHAQSATPRHMLQREPLHADVSDALPSRLSWLAHADDVHLVASFYRGLGLAADARIVRVKAVEHHADPTASLPFVLLPAYDRSRIYGCHHRSLTQDDLIRGIEATVAGGTVPVPPQKFRSGMTAGDSL